MKKYLQLHRLAVLLVVAVPLAIAGCGGGSATKTDEELAAEKLAADRMACTDAGGRFESDGSCTSEAAVARQALVDAAMCTAATTECVAAHDALIAALQADVDALADDDDATNAQQAAAREALEAAQMARNGVAMRVAEIDRSTATGRAVGAAVDAANGLENARTADDIANAEALLATAEGMLTDADDYASQISMAKMAIARAKERNTVDAAVMAAEAAATGLATEYGEAAVTSAQGAVDAANMAIEDAEHLTDDEKETQTAKVTAAQTAVTVAKNANDEAARQAKAEADRKAKEEAEAKAKADAAAGKALKAAIGRTPFAYNVGPTATGATPLNSAGLVLTFDADQGEAGEPEDTPRMKPGASAGSLSGWAGTNYAHTNAGTKISNSAVVYTNREAAKTYPIASRYATAANVPTNAGTYDAANRRLPLGDAADSNIKSGSFPTAGTKTFTVEGVGTEVVISGTYQGASGNYRCTPGDAGTDCTATAGSTGIITLSSAWDFVHSQNTMVSIPDSTYLYFGWWLRKDKDDEPTEASAFTGVVGTAPAPVDPRTIGGKATYTGGAAGKFAVSDPLTGGDAGHFTADATLNATFGTGATNGLSGTIENFMANGEAVPWSVTLFRRAWDTTTIGQTADTDDPNTASVNESMTQTVWSIDGNTAAASGTWNAMAYDEKPGLPAVGGDGSNVPTSVTGSFHSEFGSTHSMVGAFGATME